MTSISVLLEQNSQQIAVGKLGVRWITKAILECIVSQ